VSYLARSRLSDGIEVRRSAVEGQGLFASRRIEAGAELIVYGGRLATDDEVRLLRPHSSLAVGEGFSLIQQDEDEAQYLNHSCDGNTWMLDAVTLVARRDINAEEELTMDYVLVSGADPAWSMPCSCRSTLCRGAVTGSDWRLPELQERYRGHFSPFLNARIGNK